MDFLQIIMTPFSWLLRVFCELFNSYGIALILFTIIIKIILFPLNLKGKKGMIKMSLVSGQLRELQKRYGNDRERYNREVQKFYAENKVSPTGGCLWSLLPLLILWPLYAIIRRPFRYMMGLSDTAITSVATALDWTGVMGSEYLSGANELTLASMLNSGNLAAAEAAAGGSLFIINFSFLGLDLSQIPTLQFWQNGVSWGSIGLFLMPIFSAGMSLLSMIVSQKTNRMNRSQEQDQAAASTNRTMMIISPVISLWIGYSMPAGLCIYWIANSLLGMVQELLAGRILRKDYEQAQRELEEQAKRAKLEEKERRRIAAERKAAAIAAGTYKKGKQNQGAGKEKGVDVSASREGIRAYARGRAYDPNRYPITPYRDPNEWLGNPSQSAKPAQPSQEEPEDQERVEGQVAPERASEQSAQPPVSAPEQPDLEQSVQEQPDQSDSPEGLEGPEQDGQEE